MKTRRNCFIKEKEMTIRKIILIDQIQKNDHKTKAICLRILSQTFTRLNYFLPGITNLYQLPIDASSNE